MSLTVKILLTAYFLGHLLFTLHEAIHIYDDYGMDYFLPTTLYKRTKMNMAGCIFCSILLFTVNYLYCSTYLVFLLFKKLKIVEGIVWLFTVGRKDEEMEERQDDDRTD